MNGRVLKNLIRLLAASIIAGCPAAFAKESVATPTAQADVAKPVPVYDVVKEKSSLRFTATQNNAPVEGKFTAFTADIAFDPEQLKDSHIRVEVDVASLELADSQTKDTLLTADWLDAKGHPKAVFVSKEIDRIPGTNDYYAKGELNLHGVKAPVTLNFTMAFMDENSAIANGYLTIQRTDFHVGQGEWSHDDVVKKAVRVEFRIAANRKH